MARGVTITSLFPCSDAGSRLNETVTQFGHCNGETATHQPDLIGTKVPDSTAAHVAPAVQPGVVKAEEAAVSKHSRTLRVLTYNVGLLAWRAPGGRALFENPPYVDGRKAQVAPVILDTKADIICLQVSPCPLRWQSTYHVASFWK